MPRSNKKKSWQKVPLPAGPSWISTPKPKPPPEPPPKPTSKTTSRNENQEVEILLGNEKDIMVARAMASAAKHGITLRHGRTNPGTGDCAFEAIIYNINERPCFKEKFLMSIDWYRRIWVTDMANRTVHSPYNTLDNAEDWLSGWSEMLIPGTYERGIYGDFINFIQIFHHIRKIVRSRIN